MAPGWRKTAIFEYARFSPDFLNKAFDRVWRGAYTPASQHGAAWSASVLSWSYGPGRGALRRLFFDIVFLRRDAWAAVVLLGIVSGDHRPVTFSILTCTIAYPRECPRMCEPCKFWVTGSCLFWAGLFGLVLEQQLESLILAQNERWRHA